MSRAETTGMEDRQFTTRELVDFIQTEIDVTPAMPGFNWDVWEQKQIAVIARLHAAEALYKALLSASDVISSGEYPVTYMDVQDGFKAWGDACRAKQK
jgi:hypothetical protein